MLSACCCANFEREMLMNQLEEWMLDMLDKKENSHRANE
jgi:hypothetical protein